MLPPNHYLGLSALPQTVFAAHVVPALSYGALIDFGGLRPVVRKTKLTAEFDYQKFTAGNGENVIPLFVLKPKNVVQVRTVTNASDPVPGDVIISLVRGT